MYGCAPYSLLSKGSEGDNKVIRFDITVPSLWLHPDVALCDSSEAFSSLTARSLARLGRSLVRMLLSTEAVETTVAECHAAALVRLEHHGSVRRFCDRLCYELRLAEGSCGLCPRRAGVSQVPSLEPGSWEPAFHSSS